MRHDFDKVIDDLAQDLQPARKLLSPLRLTLLWWTASWGFVVGTALLTAPLRPGALDNLVTVPQFTIEIATGLLAGFLVSLAAFRLAVPGLSSNRWLLSVVVALFCTWVLAYVVGLEYPALMTGMMGKRPHCALEMLAYSTPLLLAAAWLFARRYTIRSVRAGLLAGAAAGAVPALMMQLACMYEPVHILKYHMAPIVCVALFGALLFYFLLRLKR